MKTILILRHAKSDWSHLNRADFDRPLAKRGLKDAPRMGEVLALFECVPDTILSSPAVRAKQTAESVAKACGYRKSISWQDSFYGGNSEDLIMALQRLPDTIERPMLVGHNPTLEETVARLLDRCRESRGWNEELGIRIPTAGLVCLDVDIIDWAELEAGDAVLRWFLIPKLIRAVQ
ncbi:MAG: histidine phosphatase family protein [Anaerolineales bacterium]|nr:MAG: histidine phosphatase family protein [Anaerolineales bacterium]